MFLDEGTQSKITFVKEDHALLHEVVDKAILPPQLGGTRAADDHFMTTSDGTPDHTLMRRACLFGVTCWYPLQ